MNKKLSFVLVCFLCAASVNAFEFADKKVSSEVDAVLAKKSDQVSHMYYGYKPIVFELRSSFARIPSEAFKDIDRNMMYVETGLPVNSANPDVNSKCYATVINKDWLLTDKSCIYSAPKKGIFTFKLKTLKFYRGGYKTVIANISKMKYYEDKATGAVLLNVGSVCLDTTSKTPTGICMRFWDWIGDYDEGAYKIPQNYASIVLANIISADARNKDFKLSFVKRAFFTPFLKGTALTVSDIYANVLVIPSDLRKIGSPLPGEPLFHKNAVKEQILVALNTAPAGKARVYKVFGPGFAAILRKAAAGSGVIITTDLNARHRI